MKLGAFYNFFDGEELLEKSILSIRQNVDFVVVIFQQVSNFGNKGNPDNLKLLRRLMKDKTINYYHLYLPDLDLMPVDNEINKRNLGLRLCLQNRCTHVLGMDADEFYMDKEFKYAKQLIEKKDYDSTACQMLTFYKKPIYQITPPEDYSVPFIVKIGIDSEYVKNSVYPVLIDPTRGFREPPKNFYKFKRDELQMYHMSYVRNNIISKVMNSSAKADMINPNSYIDFFDNWKPGIKNMHPVVPELFEDVVTVADNFAIGY